MVAITPFKALVCSTALLQISAGFLFQDQTVLDSQRQLQVAIIGAGAAGSATAYHLAKQLNNGSEQLVNITLFETLPYIGGRSVTLSKLAPNVSDLDVEMGASIFISKNQLIMEAVEEFNLTLQRFSIADKNDTIKSSMGIWDGKTWKYRSDSSNWNKLKYYLRYARQFWKLRRLVNKVIEQWFLKWFYQDGFPFQSLDEVEPEMKNLVNQTAYEYLVNQQGFDESFVVEFISSLTRINYSQDVTQLHALASLVTAAALFGDVWQVKGGNFQIFEKFVEFSGAFVQHNNKVQEIINDHNIGKFVVVDSYGMRSNFDQVVIATPLKSSGLTLTNFSPLPAFEDVTYANLHVYIVGSGDLVSGSYFNSSTVPTMIATISGETQFYSINLVEIQDGSYVYKIFSPLKDLELSQFFPTGFELLYHKEWQPYPLLDSVQHFGPFEIAKGLWYLNTMERFTSTMETECVAGSNVASLISKSLKNSEVINPANSWLETIKFIYDSN